MGGLKEGRKQGKEVHRRMMFGKDYWTGMNFYLVHHYTYILYLIKAFQSYKKYIYK